MSKLEKIYEPTTCLSEELLMRYATGHLDSETCRKVERHLLDCEMCTDTVEGFRALGSAENLTRAVRDLNQKVRSRVSAREEGVIIILRKYRTPLAIAASVLLVIGSVWFFRQSKMAEELDGAAADKIFADQFVPYPSESQSSESEQSTAVNESLMPLKPNSEEVFVKRESGSGAPSEDQPKDVNLGFAAAESPVPTQEVSEEENRQNNDVPAIRAADAVQSRDELSKNQDKAAEPRTEAAPSLYTTAPAAGAVNTASEAALKEEKKSAEKEADGKKSELAVAQSTQRSKAKYRVASKRSVPQKAPAATAPAVQSDVVLADDRKENQTRADSASAQPDLQPAFYKYEKGDYAGAIEIFEKELQIDPTNEKALFYAAVSYLSVGLPDKAIPGLMQLAQDPSGLYYDEALWYLSLAYIKKKDSDNARINLMRIQNNEKSQYRKQADDLIKNLPR